MGAVAPAATQDADEGTTSYAADVLETRRSSLNRLSTLLRLAEGAWALAVYEDGNVQRQAMDALRRVLDSLPVIQVSLLDRTPNPLAILRSLRSDHPAPVVVFEAIGERLAELCGYLDVQRESLAEFPHRLLLWASDYERRELAAKAPNFYSRLSGIFYFPGAPGRAAGAVASGLPAVSRPPAVDFSLGAARRRSYVVAEDSDDRARRIEYYRRRIHDLSIQPHPACEDIGDAWYDLAGLYETGEPRRWAEAEAAYAEAARAYARGGCSLAEAEARYRAGDAAMRSYAHTGALDHLEHAWSLYRLLADSPERTPEALRGEANVLQAQGDVLAFLDQRDEALRRYEQALQLFRAVGDRLGEANVLLSMGDLRRKGANY